jgi:hypothetical protein
MRSRLANLLFVVTLGLTLGVAAQTVLPPPKLEPVPEPEPRVLPPEVAADPELQPQVTTVERENEKIEEYRVKGRLTMVKVTPRHGRPYYLVPEGPDGAFVRHDSLDTGLKVPMWLLYSF